MNKIRPLSLVLWGLVGLVAGGCLCYVLESTGRQLPPAPWPAIGGMVLLSLVLLILGLPIKRWNDGDRKEVMDPLLAARVAIMARAAAFAGAILTGFYGGHLLYLLISTDVLRVHLAIPYAAAFLAAVVLLIVGLIVEWFCRLPPDDPREIERKRRESQGRDTGLSGPEADPA